MITYPGECYDLDEARMARYLLAEDFEKVQKARIEAFENAFHFFTSLVSRIFKRKAA